MRGKSFVAGGVLARHEAGSARCAVGGVGIGLIEEQAIGGHVIQVGCIDEVGSRASHIVPAHIVPAQIVPAQIVSAQIVSAQIVPAQIVPAHVDDDHIRFLCLIDDVRSRVQGTK